MEKEVKAIMLDLETFDTAGTAVVRTIGAVMFVPELGLGKEFYARLEPGTQQKAGRTVSADTMLWWMMQSQEARGEFANGVEESTSAALAGFAHFVSSCGDNVAIWGNGSDFDNVILGSLYADMGIVRPWSHARNRCFRTLKNLGISLPPGAGAARSQFGPHHDALADAKFQAHYACAWLKELA